MAKRSKSRIFCLEGDWSPQMSHKLSVRPALELLHGYGRADFLYRDVGTVEELEFYLRRWGQKQYASYPIAYLGFHGDSECISVGRRQVYLDELAEWLRGKCRGRIIHFGSCGTLDTDLAIIRDFVHTTGARFVCGFKAPNIDWMTTMAFEILLLTELLERGRSAQQLKDHLRTKRPEVWSLAVKLRFRAVGARA